MCVCVSFGRWINVSLRTTPARDLCMECVVVGTHSLLWVVGSLSNKILTDCFTVRRSIKTPALVLKNEISWNCSILRDTVDSFVTCHIFKCEARSRPVNNQPELTIYIFGTSNNAPNRVQDDWRREVLLFFFVRWKIVATTHYYHHHQVDSYR